MDNLRTLVLFRTVVITAQVITIAYVHVHLEIPQQLLPLAGGIGFLALFNLATWLRLRFPQPVYDGELFAQIVVDVAVFTVLLYFTGGITNPFVGTYMLPLAVSAVMLRRSYTWSIAAITGACYLLLAFFPLPLTSANFGTLHYLGLHEIGEATSLAITIPLVMYFVIRITTMLREHQSLLAQAKENELNNERIVQLGAFAAGAAHELGTPLSTMAVVVKELRERWHARPELLSELRVISDQLQVCKNTLSNLLASAGRPRMDGGGKLALDEFLKSVVDNFRSMRAKVEVTYRWDGALPAPEIVADQSLRQAIVNLLNNAADASPEQIDVVGRWDEQELWIRISDRGLGIRPEALDKIGKGGFSAKPPGEGHGVGLMLSATIIRRFGGSIQLYNQPGCGACAEVRLPLAPFLVSAIS
jgi:two-component system sensor histidine kinase RegB